MLKVLLKVNMCSKWYYTLSIFKEILILSHFLRVLLLIIYIKQPCQGWGRGFDPRLALSQKASVYADSRVSGVRFSFT